MRKIIMICMMFFVSACANQLNKTMESWVGHPESELVSMWGAPTTSIDTRDGKRILTWVEHKGTYGQILCRKNFTIDEVGVVTGWSWRDCSGVW